MSNTNTVLKIFAIHGFGAMAVFLGGIIQFCRKHLGKRHWFWYAVLIGMILSNEDMIFDTCIYIFMMYGYVNGQGETDENKTGGNQRSSLREYRPDHVSAGRSSGG
jgi:hypothetical protein